VDKIRQQAGRLETAESPTLQALSPIHINGPKFVTVDVLKGPLRPIPAMTASFVHTESTYSRRSERSDAEAPLDEQDEGSNAHDAITTAEDTGDPPIPTITTIDIDPPPPVAPAPLPPLRVLIVDDDPLTRLLMSRVSQRRHFSKTKAELLRFRCSVLADNTSACQGSHCHYSSSRERSSSFATPAWIHCPSGYRDII
jgi:hypothetical protein